MSAMRVLIVDDQLARNRDQQVVLFSRTGLVAEAAGVEQPVDPGNMMHAHVIAGQREQCGHWYNDYELIRQAVAYGWGDTARQWNLILLDVNFVSGALDANGIASGEEGDEVFGEVVFDRLRAEFDGLPLVMFTMKSQRGLVGKDKPFVSKEGFRSAQLRETLLRYGKLDVIQTRRLLELPANVIAAAPSTIQIFKDALFHADHNISVMILGETGTGKEVLARYVHAQSGRRDKAFIPVNVAAIPAGLAEAILFGAEKGAYTGAHKSTKGVFEQADGGTLFLDEIGDMALDIQAKVLRALQERVITRVGGQAEIPVDVRIISATHRPMRGHVQSGMFRQDLWERLNTIPISLPALRERRADIDPLAEALLARFQAEFGKTGIEFDSSALAALQTHPFPGNVREFENLMRRLVSVAGNNSLIMADQVRAILDKTADGSVVAREIEQPRCDERVPAVQGMVDTVAFIQDLRLRELELLIRVLESTRSVSTGLTDRKDAAARLIPGKKQYSTNDFDRWLIRVWKALNAEGRALALGRFPALAEFKEKLLQDFSPCLRHDDSSGP